MATYTFTSNGLSVAFDFTSKSNKEEILKALQIAVKRGLSACGEKAVGYAQDNCPVDTGRLRGSITYAVDGDDCIIGTNVEYAAYVEFGTGKFAETGGRQTPWTYQDGKGQWHFTEGVKPQPFLRPAAANHAEEYRNILKESLLNA